MYIHTLSLSKIGNELYFASTDSNALFKMDLDTFEMEYVISFERYPKDQKTMFENQIQFENKLYFIPYNAEHLVIYDIGENTCEYVDMSFKKGFILKSFPDGENLWILMRSYPNQIYRMNLKTKKTESHSLDWNGIFRQLGEDKRKMDAETCEFPFWGGVLEEGVLWLVPNSWSGCLISYDTATKETGVHKIKGYEKEKFYSLAIQGDVLLIVLREKNEVLEWNRKTQEIKKFSYDAGQEDTGSTIMSIAVEKYWLIAKSKTLVILEQGSGNTYSFPYSSGVNRYRSYVKSGDDLLLYPLEGKQIQRVNLKEKKRTEREVFWDKKMSMQDTCEIFGNQLTEEMCDLSEYLNMVSVQSRQPERKEESVGDAVWKYLKDGK